MKNINDNQFVTNNSDPLSSQATKSAQVKKNLLFSVLILVLLLAGASIIYLLSINSNKTTEQTTQQSSVNTEPKDIADQIRTKLTVIYKDNSEVKIETAVTPNAPLKQSAIGQYYIIPGARSDAQQIEITLPTSNTTYEVVSSSLPLDVEDILSGAGYTKTNSLYNGIIFANANKDTVCDITLYNPSISIRCGLISAYVSLDSQIKPLADAYLVKHKDADLSNYAFGVPDIYKNDGTTQKASVSMGSVLEVGGWSELFYTTGEGWIDFMGTQAMIPCSDFNTDELRKVYEGTQCYDTEKSEDSVVVIK